MLEIRNLKKNFGPIEAVKGINITIKEGELVGLLGPNGAGKSTTISMIATLYKPTEGDIVYGGKSIMRTPSAIQPHLGYVPQEIALYDTLSGYDNLKYFGGLYGLKGDKLKSRIEAVSEIIGIGNRLKDKVNTYSGGMQRRLNIGVALLHEPEIIIMDEPTVGIDPQSRNHILETVKELNAKGMTVIYTSHYMEEVEAICKRIYIMDEGKVIAAGTREELIEQSDVHTKIQLTFSEVDDQLIDQLKLMPEVLSAVVDKEGQVELLSTGGEHSAQVILKRLLSETHDTHFNLLSFDVIKPDLEQIFLTMTGKALRD